MLLSRNLLQQKKSSKGYSEDVWMNTFVGRFAFYLPYSNGLYILCSVLCRPRLELVGSNDIQPVLPLSMYTNVSLVSLCAKMNQNELCNLNSGKS